jgi:hypothetical protein
MYRNKRFEIRLSLSLSNAAIAIALGALSCLPVSMARAQSTTSSIFGQAPSGTTVTAHSSSGFQRHETVSKKGRYKLSSLPTGDYTVTLQKDGQTVDTRTNIPLVVGRGAEVDFACPNDHCEASD